MVTTSIWKNVILFVIGSVFALHLQVARAQEDSETVKTTTSTSSTTGDEECVITEDQYKRIN